MFRREETTHKTAMKEMRISISIDDDILSGSISNSRGASASTEYSYHLLRAGKVVQQGEWSKNHAFQCRLTVPGTYKVKAFIRLESGKVKSKFATALPYFSASFDADWERLLESPNDGGQIIPPLTFAPVPYPNHDFAVVHLLPKLEIQKLPAGLIMESFTWPGGGESHLVSFRGSTVDRGTIVVFSGSTQLHDPLIFGQKDILNISTRKLFTAGGDFSFALKTSRNLQISNDYFGVQKLYLYTIDHSCIVSNNYHLLLILLTAYQIPTEIDKTVSRAILTSGTSQLFQQLYSEQMPIAGTRLLAPTKRIELTSRSFHFKEKEIAKVIQRRFKPIGDRRYLEMIEKGKQEIIRNLRVVFKHPNFSSVLVDLTGGMDSRTVFAGLTNLYEYKPKAKIHSYSTATRPNDQPIALSISEFFGFHYDDLDEEHHVYNYAALLNEYFSQMLGTYFALDPRKLGNIKKLHPEVIRIVGSFGEICLRSYYSRRYVGENKRKWGRTKFVRQIMQNRNHNFIGSSEDIRAIKKILAEALNSIPGRNIVERYENHYLFFRNGLHFSDRVRFNRLTPQVGVLQSKWLFCLKRGTFSSMSPVKIQNDVISALNPVLSAFPYEAERDNLDRDLASETLYHPDERFRDLRIPVIPTLHNFRAARGRKTIVRVDQDVRHTEGRPDVVAYARAALKELVVRYGILDESGGRLLFLQFFGDDKDYITMNKIIMLYYQLTTMSWQQPSADNHRSVSLASTGAAERKQGV